MFNQKLSLNYVNLRRSGILAVIAASVFVTVFQLLMQTTYAQAVQSTSENCFDFSSGVISNYYDNESNDSTNSSCPRDVVIPDSIGGEPVISVAAAAFYDKSLSSVIIPNTVIEIGNGAFANNQLSVVVIPSSVDTIGGEAFLFNQIKSLTIEGNPANVNHGFLASQGMTGFLEGTPSTDNILITFIHAPSYTGTDITSFILRESELFSDDIDNNGFDDIVAGQILNPAIATINYKNQAGDTIRASDSVFSSSLTDQYARSLVALNPDVDDGNLASYYYAPGDTAAITIPAIAGYTASITDVNLVLEAGSDNQATIVYRSNSDADIDSSGESQPTVPGAPNSGVASEGSQSSPIIALGVLVTSVLFLLDRGRRFLVKLK